MFSSLRARLWLSYGCLIITALTIVAAVLILFLLRNPYLYRQTLLRVTAASGVLTRNPRAAGQIDEVAQAFNVRVLVFDSSGTLLEDSGDRSAGIALPAAPLTRRAFPATRDTAGRVWLYSLDQTSEGNWLLVAAPRPKLVPALAVVTDELALPFVQGGLIALLLSLVLAYVLARWIANPLQQLVSAVRRLPARTPADSMGSGRETQVGGPFGGAPRVPERGPIEVRELTRAFNEMTGRVLASQRSQREFVADVSHELKTPLTSIQGFAQALIDGAAETPAARQHAAEVIYNEAGRMHRMALDLLDLARLDAGTAKLEISTVDMRVLLEGVVEKFRPLAAAAGVGMTLSMAGQLPAVEGDGERLGQVFANLVDNAIKFTPRDGTITLEAIRDLREVRVSVTDTGPGIEEQDLPHVFDRFYQADSARGGGEKHGAGLGLAIVQEIVAAHGGRIKVRSRPGGGAEFVVQLPLQGTKKS
jgi:signal transduction histidine kinase